MITDLCWIVGVALAIYLVGLVLLWPKGGRIRGIAEAIAIYWPIVLGALIYHGAKAAIARRLRP